MTAPRLEPLGADDLDVLAARLAERGLVADDLAAPGRRFYRLALAPGRDAYAGLELFGADALLRSVLSPQPGGGRRVVAAVIAEARRLGAGRLWLLTETAEGFFARLGFRPAPRAAAPAAIAATDQFAALCPASATLMTIDLEEDVS